MIQDYIDRYAHFVAHHPYLILLFVILLSSFAFVMMSTVTTEKTDLKDYLPEDIEAIATLFDIEDKFGSVDSIYIVIEVDPAYSGSDEIRDLRDPQVLRYVEQISQLVRHTEDVIEVSSASTTIKSINDGRLPQSLRKVRELTSKNGLLDGYISDDYTMSLVKIRLIDTDADLENIEVELGKIIQSTPHPAGIKVSLGGQTMEEQAMEKSIKPDMKRTSTYSLIGILIVVLVLFRSPKYGFIPLTTILFGTLWAMGYVGLTGMGLSSNTSGVISMIMGIGIDFGIQVTTRYRFERAHQLPPDAMELTLRKVIVPMLTTTLAALIGFQAMSMGQLTFMGDMGTMMSYGVAACMVAASTAVPSLILIADTLSISKIFTMFTKN
ncbi:MAG: MMPL family transporter [Methanosarcinales archaeon]|uniref:MMPL family transporter n=1 Tax=Candidatus Ethanoperedens thermophilum TaxID=2766897 RepID=A0A848DA29_9EURY|nr:MMPL family transporter [Candidatus Ethanoperedens thermophilum]